MTAGSFFVVGAALRLFFCKIEIALGWILHSQYHMTTCTSNGKITFAQDVHANNDIIKVLAFMIRSGVNVSARNCVIYHDIDFVAINLLLYSTYHTVRNFFQVTVKTFSLQVLQRCKYGNSQCLLYP